LCSRRAGRGLWNQKISAREKHDNLQRVGDDEDPVVLR
jgi:hypothetical protein